MKFTRRDLIHAGCTVATATLVPHFLDQAKAGLHGHGTGVPSGSNVNRVTINARVGAFMNFAKGWNPTSGNKSIPPNQIDANGYPNNVTLAISYSGGISLQSSYYGKYFHGWTGTGTMQYPSTVAIVYSGGAAVFSLNSGGGPAGTGYVTGNFTLGNAASPAVVFKFGTLVASVSGGSGSLVTITTVASLNFGAGLSTNSKISFNQGCSSNLVNGPNSDGSWTITNVSGTQFTLNGSTGVVSPTVTGSGGVGTQTEAIIAVSAPSLNYGTVAFSGFTGLIICTQANQAAIVSGSYWDPIYVAQLQELKGTPGGVGRAGEFWLRFMDLSAVIGSYEADFSQRFTPTSQCWTNQNNTPIGYYAGAMTNGGASGAFTDVYSCASNPTASPASGPPVDCEVIQGTPNVTNSGGLPALTISGRTGFGTWPIFDSNGGAQIFLPVSGSPASAGLSCVFTFGAGAASWLNGGSNYVFTYTTVAGDVGSTSTFQNNLVSALTADTVLYAGGFTSARIYFSNSGEIGITPPTALSGALTVTYTSGPAIVSVSTLKSPDTIGSASIKTFVFNALQGGFALVAGFPQSLPIEAITQLCNLVGANCWYNWPIYTKAAYITACTNLFASAQGSGGLASGLKFGAEFGNEIWNPGTNLFGRGQSYGVALGLYHSAYGNFDGNYSWQGLMTIQYAAFSRAAWASAGRTASQHYVLLMGPEFDAITNSNFDLTCCKGQYLLTSTPNYANFGTLGGTALATSYNVAGSQPVDSADAIGCAPYWGSPWFEEAAASPSGNGVKGTVTQNAPMLQASFDYINGSPATAFGELTNQFNGTTTRSGGSSGGITLNPGYTSVFTNEEAQAAQYDARRTGAGKTVLSILHYEGGPQWAMGGANYANGVNSASSLATAIASGDISALATVMNNNGWTTTQLIPYTVSGTGNLTEVATNILQMAQGWKYDTDANGNAVNTGSYKTFIKTSYYANLIGVSSSHREVHPCEYGYAGSQWGLMWSGYNTPGAFYQNYYAVAEQNA